MSRKEALQVLPTPFEVAAIFGAAYFFWYLADGMSGVAYAVGGIALAIVLSRAIGVWGRGKLPPEAAWILVGVLAALTAPFIASGDFRVTQLAIFGYTALIVVGLNLLSGNLGQVSFAHAAFIGIGAYTVAISVNEWDMPIALAMLLSIFVAAAAGVLLGVPAVRLSGPYLAIATVGLGIIFPSILTLDELVKYTGGFQGISLFQHKYAAPIHMGWLTNERWYYFITMGTLLVGIVLAYNLVNSAAGRALRAIHDSELAATSMGINVPYVKVVTFAISAGYAGFGGALLFLVGNRFVSPDGFGVLVAVDYLVALVLGGVASITGSVLGGFFFVYFYREGLETITSQTQQGNDKWLVSVGLGIFLAILFGNTYITAFAQRMSSRVGRWGVLLLAGARVAMAVGLGIAMAALFRVGANHLFDVENLKNGLTGASLIIIILFMPNGVTGVIDWLRSLTWEDIGSWAGSLLPSDAAAAKSAARVPSSAPDGSEG